MQHERLFANQQNAMANFQPFKYVELFFVPWQDVYKYCDKSFINKPTYFNFVPQLIKKTYRAGTAWFSRFVCAIAVQAHFFNDKTANIAFLFVSTMCDIIIFSLI